VKLASEIEIWKSARTMVVRFGEAASARAQRRAEECTSRADVDGWITWMRIMAAILEMQDSAPSQDVRAIPAHT
jgi:hypothetical protein